MSTITPPSNYSVQKAVALAQMTLARLRDEDGQVIETDDELAAALADEGASLDTILARLVSAALQAKADTAAAGERIAALTARKDRFARHHEAYRSTLLAVLEAVGIAKWACVEASLSVSAGKPKVQVTDAAALPAAFVVEAVTYTPDKAAIKAALEAGQDVSGAVLGNGQPVITIRSK